MKTVFCLLVLVMLTACSGPSFDMQDGSQKSIDDYAGQYVLVNYWAEWCHPCLEEIPELNLINEDSGIQVLGVDFDNSQGQALNEKLARLGIEFPVVTSDPSSKFSQASPSGLPATMVIGQEGEFLRWLMGSQTVASIKAALQ